MNKFLIFSGGEVVGSAVGATADMPGAHEVTEALFAAYTEARKVYSAETHRITFDTDKGLFIESIPLVPCTINKTTIKADGADLATITGLPPGSKAFIEGVGLWDVEDDFLEISTDEPGTYQIRVSADGFQPREFTLYAN